MQILSSLQELDTKLEECEAAHRVSDDALRAVFQSFCMDVSQIVPQDPFSDDYRRVQMELYAHIAGQPYKPTNEATKFDVEAADRRPFPFSTQSCSTVGFFLMGTGFLLHSLDLRPGARVLELGAGWGNSTIAMSMLGLDVTAVDIEPDFCELLRRRAVRHELDIRVVNADFMWVESVREPYDAVVFFESFHHCSDHLRLFRALGSAVKPDGAVYFGAEPIVADADFPIPWGLRLDGESLWAIRANGWLELGFRESYFREALARAGWNAVKHVYPDLGWAAVWEARQVGSEIQTVAEQTGPSASSPAPNAAIRVTGTTAKGDDTMMDKSPTESELVAIRAELAAVYASWSWRITAPCRRLARALKQGRNAHPRD